MDNTDSVQRLWLITTVERIEMRYRVQGEYKT